MKALGFSGTRHLDSANVLRICEYFRSDETQSWLAEFDRFVTGACVGFDALIGGLLVDMFPEKQHTVVVPADRSRVDYWWEEYPEGLVEVIEMPPGSSYRDRNTVIVDLGTQLFYCAEYDEDHGKSKHSGTWMTVRIARNKRGKRADGLVLDWMKGT